MKTKRIKSENLFHFFFLNNEGRTVCLFFGFISFSFFIFSFIFNIHLIQTILIYKLSYSFSHFVQFKKMLHQRIQHKNYRKRLDEKMFTCCFVYKLNY